MDAVARGKGGIDINTAVHDAVRHSGVGVQ